MDLRLSEKHGALQAELQAFITRYAAEAPKAGGGRKRPDVRTLDWQKRLVEHGYAARTVPRAYGGLGAELDVVELAVIADAFVQAGVHPGLSNQGISMLVPTLLEVGTEAQRQEWIGPTIRGDVIWCQGYSEPGAGSDLAAAKTRAEFKDGHFIVNGQKIWTSSAHYADMMFLLCRTEPDRPRHQGLSYLILSMKTPGIEVRPLRTMTGRAEFNETFFTDVRVPAENIVMGRGQGWHVANITLKHERLMLGDSNRLTQRLHKVTEMLQRLEIDGEKLIAIPSLRERLLQLQGEVLAWRAHGLRLLTDQSRGVDSGLRRLITKYGATMLCFRLSSLAVDALGTAGLPYEVESETVEADEATTWHVDHFYDIGLIIGGGSSNIQKNIIGERGLDLPREPKLTGTAAGGS